MIDKRVFLGMNKDASEKDLKPGEYKHAENLVAVSDGVGKSVRLENMQGTEEAPLSIPGGVTTAKCVGLWNYREDNKVYGFYEGSFIIEYDGITGQSEVLMSTLDPDLLGFKISNPVHDVWVVDGLLYFNSTNKGLRKINIEYAKTGALNSIIDERVLSVIKPPPLNVIQHWRFTDDTKEELRPEIRETPIQFCSRYVYNDNEISVLSPISEISGAVDWDYNTNKWNAIGMNILVDLALMSQLKRVELIYRVGNRGNWSIYDKIDISLFTENYQNWEGLVAYKGYSNYKFYYDKTGAVLSEQEVDSSQESVPRLSDAATMMEDRIFATSSTEEYDIDFSDFNFNVKVNELANEESELNSDIYECKYYKERSSYSLGIVFMDEYGRKSAPDPDFGVITVKIPDTFTEDPNNTVALNGSGLKYFYDTPNIHTISPVVSGKPPVWAKKYQFVRSENQTYNSWYKVRLKVKPLITDVFKGEEEPSDPVKQLGVYLENGYWYADINKYISDLRANPAATNISSFLKYWFKVDIILDRELPIPLDKNTRIRMSFAHFKYVTHPGDYVTEFTIDKIEDDRIRITGLQWLDVLKTFNENAEAIRGEKYELNSFGFSDPNSRVIENDELYLNFEFLNPSKKIDEPPMFEIGDVYEVSNPGEDGRAFQVSHTDIPGDCYYTGFNSDYSSTPRSNRDNRQFGSVAYPSLSPIVEPDRVGKALIITVGDEDTIASSQLDPGRASDSGLYTRVNFDSKGRATATVAEQKELNRSNQIRFSRTFIQDSLINGLSNFPEENKYTTSSDRGDIVKLVPVNEKILVAIHKRSITTLYINRQFISTGEGTEIATQTDKVIGEDRRMAMNYGSNYPESIVPHNNIVYGFDGVMSEPWRRGQDGITPLALTYGMKTYFEEKAQKLIEIENIDPSATIRVLGGYDPWLEMYILTFDEVVYINGNGEQVTVEAETLGFSERVKKWVSFYSYKPEYYTTIMNNLVSAKDNSLWIHLNSDNRNLIYGANVTSKLTLVSSKSDDASNIFQYIGLSSNKPWSVEMLTQDGKRTMMGVENFTLRDTMLYADILRDITTDSATLKPGQTPLLHGEKMIGEWLEVRLTNDDSSAVNIDAVYLGYSPMTGHLLSMKK